MTQPDHNTIFFHVGLERTGTTFLQKNVFPAFSELIYIPKKRFDQAPEIIQRASGCTILVSREFNRDFENAIVRFKQQVDHPVIPIIVLREPVSWLLSQYKRYVKNGCSSPIEEFFPLEKSAEGILNRDALDHPGKLRFLEEQFGRPPVIWYYEDLLADPVTFVKNIGRDLGVTVNRDKVNLGRRHVSYSDHQTRVLYWSYHHLVKGSFRKTRAYRYTILTLARLLPEKWFDSIDLFPASYLAGLQQKYRYYR